MNTTTHHIITHASRTSKTTRPGPQPFEPAARPGGEEGAGGALAMLEEQARECGATLVVATHDVRAKARIEKCIEL